MPAVTEDSNVVLKAPVAAGTAFAAIKQKGVFGWDETAQTFTVCPADGSNYVLLGLHPDSAPLAGSLNNTDTVLISVGGVLKRTTVQAIGGGGTWQPLDADLTAIAALATQAFGRSLLTQADAVSVRTLIGAPSTSDLSGYQPLDSDLTAIAALTTTAFGRSILTQVDAAAVRTLIGAGTSSFNGTYTSLSAIPAAIDALDALTPAADRLPYFSGASAAALATLTPFARTLLDDADAATARTTLGAGTVSSVALSLPAIFTVSGSPITGSGTLSASLASQTADKVFASPSGASGAPAFISLAASHIPGLPWSKITSGLPTTLSGYGITDAQPLDADLTAIAALATTGFLQRTGANAWTLVASPTPAAHEASHRAGGSDQLNLTNIFGGRTVDTPQFAGLTLSGALVLSAASSVISSNTSDGSDSSVLSLVGGGAVSTTRGAIVQVHGNERVTTGGTLYLAAGDGVQGIVELATGGSTRISIAKTGEVVVNTSLKVGTTFNGLAAFTNGLFRQATSSDLPGILNALSQLANGNGALRNNGSGTVSWEAVLPIASYSPTAFADFGDTTDASSYPMTANKGLALTDARALNWRGGFLSTDTFWGVSQDAGAVTSFKPFIVADGTGAVWYKNDPQDTSFKHYLTGNTRISGDVDITGEIKQGGTVAIGLSRAGALTSLSLENLANTQIPVANSSKVLVASGLTDDGTFFGISRTIRAWNSMARSGNTWTDLQWTPDAQERVSMMSSNGSGVGAYHTFVVVPADSEATGRELGYYSWGQKLSGKSGSYPGLKASLGVTTKGAGGSTGGFGAQFHFDYRPDNGNLLTTALRIGAFGGSTADAVETSILLRALSGAKVAGDFVLDSTPSAGGTAGEILQRDTNGRISRATPNVFYLSAYYPESIGTSTVDVTKHRSSTHSGSWTLDDMSKKFHKQTGTGTLSLPTASATYEGREYKITFHGRFNFTVAVASGYIYTLAAGASYWYNVTTSTVSAGDASGDNCSCDIWCDGSNWYVRW